MFRSLILLAGVPLLFAQQPQITNAQLKQASAAKGLEPAVGAAVAETTGPLWIGYAVPAIPRQHTGCWQEGQGNTEAQPVSTAPVRLEGPSHFVVLMRYEQRAPGTLRVLSPDCPLDAGGLPFYWLSEVRPAESISLLKTLIAGKVHTALHAIAVHAGPEAAAALVELTGPDQSERIRKNAMFWLAKSRGRQGFDVVERILRGDASEKVREHAVFALMQSKEAGAIPAVIRSAKEDKAPRVRKQAVLWLGRTQDPRATEFFEQVLSR
jgi:hypothetical protein